MAEQDNVHRVPGRSGVYEVWFLTLTDPVTGRGYWIRSTYLTPKQGPASAGVWFARFDPADPELTFGVHSRSAIWSISTEEFDVRIDGGVMGSGRAEGSVEGGGHDVRWGLEYPTGGETYRLLPQALYRGRMAPTKPVSPNVDTRVSGFVSIDGERSEISNAHGQQGHVWGERHALRWAWAHCGDFMDEEAIVHMATARGRRGPLTTPYVTFAGVRWDGRWIRLRRVSRKPDFGLGMWRVDLESRRYRLTGRIEAPATALLRATYEDPDGSLRYCHNSEIASCRLALFERRAGGFDEVALLESRGTTHAEWAGRTAAPQVEREFVEATAGKTP
ncbi:MAG TPA: tocopherol cyclase family protein [Actinomycetota bacterium]|nr:tocopherol cyclase family protein [Actinomycetota bacterium]